jgi:putative FmdB family regulatory protein
MPIYEYFCPECRVAFEKLRPIQSNDNEVTCPRCGSKVKRMLSVVAAVGRSSGDESYATSGGGGGCSCGGNCSCGGHHHN